MIARIDLFYKFVEYKRSIKMNNYNAKFGLYAGIIAIVSILGFNMISTSAMMSWSSWISIIVSIVAMVLAVKEEKELNKGSISFASAFKHSWVTFLIYAVITSIFTYVLYNIIDPSLKEEIMKKTIEAMGKLSGMMGEEAYEKMIEDLEKTDTLGLKGILQGFAVQLVFPGAFVSAIIALIMKKEPNPWDKAIDSNPMV
jgi:hypothetical protein